MLNNIVNLVKDQVSSLIGGNSQIPADKKNETIRTTTSSIVDGLKNQLGSGGGLSSLLGGGSSAGKASSGIVSSVEQALTGKVGLSSSVAHGVAAAVVPAVMSLFSRKVNDPKEPGFNLQSLTDTLKGSSSHGIGAIFGKLFG
ncbi:MAG: hypothetical protein LBR65_03610 [Culturomica sp.]|jgi:hypothetical protein|nr:hypothetical protein [Culturomica sp.]